MTKQLATGVALGAVGSGVRARGNMIWAAQEAPIAGVSGGCEALIPLEMIVVEQNIDLIEAFVGYEKANRYEVKNFRGELLFLAGEKSSFCARQCCGASRAFQMKHMNQNGVEIFDMRNPKSCLGINEMHVHDKDQNEIGYVRMLWSLCCMKWPKWGIYTADGEHVLTVVTPCCVCDGACCAEDITFDVITADGARSIGSIKKKHKGIIAEFISNADNFWLKFPKDLDWKATQKKKDID